MDESGIAAYEIHTDTGGCLVNGAREFNWITFGAFGDHGNRSDGDPLVSYLNADLITNFVHCFDEPCRYAANLVTRPLGDSGHRVGTTIAQTETKRDGAHVEVFHLSHGDCLQYFSLGIFHRFLDF